MKPEFENKGEQLDISFANNYKLFFYKEEKHKKNVEFYHRLLGAECD